jgi:cytoskeleton protein RodZ
MGWGEYDLTGFGRFLRQAREYKGVSLRDAERKTRIPRRHLFALENEEFDQLPPLIYARGIVRNYAQFLGLDPMDALARFEQSHGQRSGGFRVVPAVKTTEVPSHWAPNFAIIAFMVIMSAVIFAWMYSAYFAPPDNGPVTEQARETPEAEQEVAVLEDDDDDDDPLAEGGGETLLPMGDRESIIGDSDDVADEEDVEAAGEETPEEVQTPTEPPTGVNAFSITTSQPVWVQATVDGEVVLDDVLQPGMVVTLEGETMSLNSGNAPYVHVVVNGQNYGPLGEVWDATNSYP